MGNYRIKKVERLTKNKDYTGGQKVETKKKSTVIEPWF